MTEPGAPLIEPTSKPRLPRHVKLREDVGRNRTVVLSPERVFSPNPVAIAVLKLCDGQRSVADIAAELAKTYDAPTDLILKDIVAMLTDLAAKGVVQT
jgi:pyrroloquinoline quinone biosynthesis protein D